MKSQSVSDATRPPGNTVNATRIQFYNAPFAFVRPTFPVVESTLSCVPSLAPSLPPMPGISSVSESEGAMDSCFEQTLVEVWRQTLVENAEVVELGKERYPVRRTSKRGLRQVDFVCSTGNEIRGLEQNPETKSRWAQMARSGKKVMQFLSKARYVANVVDGKVNLYVR